MTVAKHKGASAQATVREQGMTIAEAGAVEQIWGREEAWLTEAGA
jgi:hypothetical protein